MTEVETAKCTCFLFASLGRILPSDARRKQVHLVVSTTVFFFFFLLARPENPSTYRQRLLCSSDNLKKKEKKRRENDRGRNRQMHLLPFCILGQNTALGCKKEASTFGGFYHCFLFCFLLARPENPYV